MGKLKDKLYYFLVEKNPSIRQEYQDYVNAHQEEHLKNRKKHWKLLLKLNWHYRIRRKKTPFFKTKNAVNSTNVKKVAPARAAAVPAKAPVRLPYLNGAESTVTNRPEAIHFAKNLLKYDVISFDIFDTLILRPFANPTDLFYVLANRLNILNFHTIRINAEKEARAESMQKNGNHEITIYDIYEKINRKTGLSVEKGVEAELQAELDFCFANPYMKRVFDILIDQGKNIIITSDMYLPVDLMTQLLESCGYSGYSELYVSCDYSCNKRNGGLYKNILRKHKNESFVHVGDNATSDIDVPRKMGLDAVFYKNCHTAGNPYRAEGLSEIVGSLYSGIVNTHLHNGTQKFSPCYEYGFIYGGLYVVGYCNWIYQKAKSEGVEKILFLSRDGVIYQKIFNMMFDDMPNEYVYWSRIANLKYTAEINRDDILTRMVTHKAHNVYPATHAEILESFDLSHLIPLLKKYKIRSDSLLIPENAKNFENFLIDNWDDVIKSYEKESSTMKSIIGKAISNCKKVAIVDVGWAATGPLGLKYLIEEKWNTGCKVSCYVAGSKDANHGKPINDIMTGSVESYLFSRMHNRGLYDFHAGTNKGTNGIYFELFTQAPSPSFKGINDNGEFLFDIPEVENYTTIEEMHQGITDFALYYLRYSENDKFLRNISGHDAYSAFKFIIKNLGFIKKHFHAFSYARNVSGNDSLQKIETIDEIMKKTNL